VLLPIGVFAGPYDGTISIAEYKTNSAGKGGFVQMCIVFVPETGKVSMDVSCETVVMEVRTKNESFVLGAKENVAA
jgi:hypothetical protein